MPKRLDANPFEKGLAWVVCNPEWLHAKHSERDLHGVVLHLQVVVPKALSEGACMEFKAASTVCKNIFMKLAYMGLFGSHSGK